MKNIKKFGDFMKLNEELSPLQKEYREFFRWMLDRYGVKSPASLSEQKKKDFFNEIQLGWVKGSGVTDKYKKEMKKK
jgi:hypothetical protein